MIGEIASAGAIRGLADSIRALSEGIARDNAKTRRHIEGLERRVGELETRLRVVNASASSRGA